MRMGEEGRQSGRRAIAEMYQERAEEYRRYADTLREAVLDSLPPPNAELESDAD
jgi:two-component system chemotaxis response regulator CheB